MSAVYDPGHDRYYQPKPRSVRAALVICGVCDRRVAKGRPHVENRPPWGVCVERNP
jgi:hypothetical protein